MPLGTVCIVARQDAYALFTCPFECLKIAKTLRIPAQKTLMQTPEGLMNFGVQRRQPIICICQQGS